MAEGASGVVGWERAGREREARVETWWRRANDARAAVGVVEMGGWIVRASRPGDVAAVVARRESRASSVCGDTSSLN